MQQTVEISGRAGPATARRAVVSFDRAGFDRECARLLRLIGRPDLLIGVRTGGLWVAEAMARAAPDIPVLPLTCRRPSTAAKQRSRLMRTMILCLPRPALDGMRLLEHRMLARRPDPARVVDAAELGALREWVAAFQGRPHLAVVDDAVDSGATLLAVLQAVQDLAPGATITSAAVTVTTSRPAVMPDHALFQRQLCRFPWSMDA